MKTFILIVASISFLAGFTGNCYSQDMLTGTQLLSIYHDKIKALNLPESYKGVDSSQFDNDLKIIYENDEWKYNRKFAIIGRKSKFEMKLGPQAGEVVYFYNSLMRTKIGKDNKAYKKGEQPKKNKKEIIKEAKRLVKIFNNGKIPEGYRLEKAEFAISAHFTSELDQAGDWEVIWRRNYDGHMAWGDALLVAINEDYGCYSYWGPCQLNYIPPKKINISQDQAIELSKKLGTELINDKNFYFYKRFIGYKIGDYVKSQMIITNPSLNGHTFIRRPYSSPDVYLFWWVQFNAVPVKKNEENRTFEANFFIDAETGALRGFQ